MAIQRVKSATGLYRDDLPSASLVIRILLVILAFLGGAIATSLVSFYFQVRFVLIPLCLWIGEGPVFAACAIVGGFAGVITLAASTIELKRALKDEELKERRARAEQPRPQIKHPKFF